MSKGWDYGYFGSGTEGYVHYKQTFDSTMQSSTSDGSRSSGSGRLPTRKEIERMSPEERQRLDEDLDKSLAQAGLYLMIVIPLVVFLMIVLK